MALPEANGLHKTESFQRKEKYYLIKDINFACIELHLLTILQNSQSGACVDKNNNNNNNNALLHQGCLKPGMPDLPSYMYNEKSCFSILSSGCWLLWDIYCRFQNGHMYQTN